MVVLSGCRETPPQAIAPLRLTLQQPVELLMSEDSTYAFGLAMSPNGRELAFAAAHLWIRDLRRDDMRPLPGTDGAALPFWSPDGAALGFFAGQKLRAIDLKDGRIRDLTDVTAPGGATWLPNGDIIVASTTNGGLTRYAPEGTISAATTLAPGELSHVMPQRFGERHVIFFVRASEAARQGVWIAALDQPESRKRLASSDAAAVVIGDAIAYSNGGALVAQRVDLESTALVAPPQLLATTVGHGEDHQLFATAGGDIMIFGSPPSDLRELRWVSDAGAVIATVGEPMQAWELRIAPTAARVAVTRVDPQLRTLDIWTYEGERPVPRRISAAIHPDETPVWSRNGSRIVWVSGRNTVMVRDAQATEPELTLRKFDRHVRVSDWSADDESIVLTEMQPGGRGDIVVMGAKENGASRMYVQTPFHESFGTISPDGRWLAYSSDESGGAEVYVDTFPTPRSRARLSVGGGTEPRWSRDGRSIIFRRGSALHTVRVSREGDALQALSSERLFDAGAEIRSFDVAPDGRRFLLNVPAPSAAPKPFTVIVNVTGLLPTVP